MANLIISSEGNKIVGGFIGQSEGQVYLLKVANYGLLESEELSGIAFSELPQMILKRAFRI